MTEFTSSTGVVRDVDLDFDRVTKYEEDHQDWSILDLVQRIQKFRLSDLDLLSQFLGFDGYKQFIDLGFKADDMADMIMASKYLGFTDSTSEED